MAVGYRIGFFAALMLAALLLSACVAGEARRGNGSDAAAESRRIGWLHDNCLALEGAAVSAGAHVAVVAFADDGRQQDLAARIVRAVQADDECPALLSDRREINQQEGWAFYLIDAVPAVDLGIGVVQGDDSGLPIEVLLDTNGDGQKDTFGYCTSAEGLHFLIWSGDAWRGDPLWHGYYYLGYDTATDCPQSVSSH